LNRIDKVVVFRALTNPDIKKIVKLHLAYLEERLRQKNISLSVTPGALEVLSKKSYDPKYGARPVRRAIQDYIEDPLTTKFLDSEFKEGDKVKIVKKESGVELVKA
jgi:ATP-dependent Clp protease ATP-binding subunit ClpA